MSFQIIDNFLDDEECYELISAAEKKQWKKEFHGQKTTGVTDEIDLWGRLNSVAKNLNNSRIDWWQTVVWEPGTQMPFHIDTGKEDTTLASIIYLNDDYFGGDTLFDDISVSPRRGRGLFFDGMFYRHAVGRIESGQRYVIATWYKACEKKT